LAPTPPPGAGVTLRCVLRGHDGPIDALAWSPDGGLLATGSYDRTARLWRAVDGAAVAVLPPGGPAPSRHPWYPRPVFHPFRPDLLATVSDQEQTVRMWQLDPALVPIDPRRRLARSLHSRSIRSRT
jgi:WD40 repeat protein